ncbi:hypothetical protein GCM10027423_46030 [Spirosoma arcticum]
MSDTKATIRLLTTLFILDQYLDVGRRRKVNDLPHLNPAITDDAKVVIQQIESRLKTSTA